jgi:tRNA pseudouridine38-40 synthase
MLNETNKNQDTFKYMAIIEYDGTNFCGMQMQKNHPSIEGEIVKALQIITKEKDIFINFAGRTDAGVHAFGQVISFTFNQNQLNRAKQKQISDYRIFAGLNFFLAPKGISVIKLDRVHPDFDPRKDAVERSYVYKITNRRAPIAIDKLRKWHVPYDLDIDKIRTAASYFIGKHDFTSFRSTECTAPNPIRSINKIEIVQNGSEIEIYIHARSFLHKMVRNIVGTLVEIAHNKQLAPNVIQNILEARNRSKAFITAPAHGLYFLKVKY